MKLAGPQVISELREKLQFTSGRHLYGVLGSYARLQTFEQTDLRQALDPHNIPFPQAVNLNRELLARIGDDDLRQLIRDEARYPQTVQRRLGQKFEQLLSDLLAAPGSVSGQPTEPGPSDGFPFRLLILKQIELLFTYELDLSLLRTRATNENHIFLLLPGQRRSEQIIMFHETEGRFQRTLPGNLLADNHLWELTDV